MISVINSTDKSSNCFRSVLTYMLIDRQRFSCHDFFVIVEKRDEIEDKTKEYIRK